MESQKVKISPLSLCFAYNNKTQELSKNKTGKKNDDHSFQKELMTTALSPKQEQTPKLQYKSVTGDLTVFM